MSQTLDAQTDEPTILVRHLSARLGVDHRKILKWIEEGHIFSTAQRTKNAKHTLTIEEATVLELMVHLIDAGISTPHAALAARGMVLAGPKSIVTVNPNDRRLPEEITISSEGSNWRPPSDLIRYHWRARMTDLVILTLETLNYHYPLARTRSSD